MDVLRIFIEWLLGRAENVKTPIVFRLLIVTVFLGTPAGLIIWGGFVAMNTSGIGWGVFCWIIAFAFIFFWIFVCYKIIRAKTKSRSKSEF